jgi:hypothetical protein
VLKYTTLDPGTMAAPRYETVVRRILACAPTIGSRGRLNDAFDSPPPFDTLQNSELLTLTYGAVVTQVRTASSAAATTRRVLPTAFAPRLFRPQLIRDYEDPVEVNAQLEQM